MKISVFLFLLIIYACSPNKQQGADNFERIPVNVHEITPDVASFIDKIEIVPLATNDSSLLHKYKKVIYIEEMDIYAISTQDQALFTFSGNGDFISSSIKVQGQGPNEYYMVVDIKFNPYLKGIDLLNPYGTIYTYSPKFDFLAKRKIKLEFPVDNLMALSPDVYVFTHPFLWTDQEVSFANMKTQQVNNANYDETVSGNTMSYECFHKVGDEFYFIPNELNYYFYKIDTEAKKLVPVMYLDFGNDEVKEDGLPGRATGKRVDSDEERSKIVASAAERYQFVRESIHIIPLMKFFNEDYVYVYLVKTTKGFGGNFIFNRRTGESFLSWEGKPFLMHHCFGIADNALLAICPPDRVSEVVEERFMSPEEIKKMKQLKEDDNPVIVKYYLKR